MTAQLILEHLREIQQHAEQIRMLLENEDTQTRRNAGYSLSDIERETALLMRMTDKRRVQKTAGAALVER